MPRHKLKMLPKVYEGNNISHTRLLSGTGRTKRDTRDERGGRLSTSRTEVNVEQVSQVECGDNRLTIRMIACKVDIKKDRVWRIINKHLGVQKVCAKLGPILLNNDQKELWMRVSQAIIDHLQTEADLLPIVIASLFFF